MPYSINQLSLYLHLAQRAGKQLRMSDRDRLLVLAAVSAANQHMPEIAAYCRHLVLSHNPGHMLKRWDTVYQAIEHPDFQHFLKQVQRRYTLEKAETMLIQAGIDRANERDTYYSDDEYAASILGIELGWLKQNFGS